MSDPTAAAAPRRVLMTADTVGGVWSYALELARALAPRGVEVHLATMGRPSSAEQRAEAAAVPGLALHESAYRLEWMDEPWEDVARAGEWLLALERELAPSLVHLNGYAHAALPFAAPVLVVAHSCVCSWWRAVRGEEAPESWDRYREAVRVGLAAADAVVAPTAAMLAWLREEYSAAPRAARVVPNGRDAAEYAPGEKEPLVLTAGRLWDEAKNVAAVALVAADSPWPVLVAGDDAPPAGAGGSPLVAGGARWLGRLSQRELAVWLARASVYALPARYEPFGLSALEAGLAGCALVLGDTPSLREVWEDAPLWVDAEDHAALADALRRLAGDDALRAEVAGRCRARALRYTPSRMAEGYLEVYRGMLAAPRAAPVEAACA